MNIYLAVILIILIGEYLLDSVVENLNLKSASSVLPQEFSSFYDTQKYKKSVFDFSQHRRTEHYRLICDQTGTKVP